MYTVKQAEILVRDLREFSTRQPTNRSLQDLGALVGKREQILVAMLGGKCEFAMRSSPEPLTVMADPIKMESALMNLAANARDQMPHGGVVTVVSGRAAIDADFIRSHGYGRIGTYAYVSVSDTGPGMDAAERERAFEPFFMAGKDWKGKGMGLSMVYDIIKEHDGYITVTSSPGRGSTYMAYLPLVH
jgi:two-component system cell cycle sensor histidine kinase/response regulator CckA